MANEPATASPQQAERPDIIDAAAALRAERLLLMNDDYRAAYLAWEQEKAGGAAPEQKFAALCLSGGGIRSAAFCLGVIQALAARELLCKFNYLSTVSGGGYIGGWLTRCIAAWQGNLAAVQKHLNVYEALPERPEPRPRQLNLPIDPPPPPPTEKLQRKSDEEPAEIEKLRSYTNYLTPTPGLASADTWAGIILWVRNTLINWAVFLPMTIAVASVPIVYFSLIRQLGGWYDVASMHWDFRCAALLQWVALACLAVANFAVSVNLPTHDIDRNNPLNGDPPGGLNGGEVLRRIGVWSLAWTFLVPLAMAPALSGPQLPSSAQSAYWHHRQNASPPAQCAAPASTAVAVAMLFAGPPAPAKHAPDSAAAAMPKAGKTPPPEPGIAKAAPVSNGCNLPMTPPRLSPEILRIKSQATEADVWDQVLGGVRLIRLPAENLAVCLLAYLCAWGFSTFRKRRSGRGRIKYLQIEGKKTELELDEERRKLRDQMAADSRVFSSNILSWLISGIISSLVLLAGLMVAYGEDPLWLALFGPIWIAVAELFRSSAYVALRQNGLFSDLDREWLARLSGAKIKLVLAAALVGAAVLLLPRLVLDQWSDTYATLAGAFAFATGPVAAFIGKTALTTFTHGTKAAKKGKVPADLIVAILSIMFAGAMFMLTGRLLIWTAWRCNELLRFLWRNLECRSHNIFFFITVEIAILGGFFLIASLVVDRAVNLNRFSMHAVYRNRLISAFLGTASSARQGDDQTEPRNHGPSRTPDRYTGFDPSDNIRMADIFPTAAHKRTENVLFPVINVALNRTTGKDTARARRKAASFTITPLHCGAPALRRWQGAYAPTEKYAGGDRETGIADRQNGMTLGTAMTISGAAVSPNMGYNSSPFAAFLMTLFNVRLGAWLPNPGANRPNLSVKQFDEFLGRSGPRRSIPTILKELRGQSDDTSDYVYLSDGGHFDNLGLYEMLRRRCAQIVVIDAGADPKYSYFSLGHTLEMAAIDLGIQVEFLPPVPIKQKKLTDKGAYAEVTYPPDGKHAAAKGKIIYLKPWLPETAPVELLSYQRVKPSFPHEPTVDQFFTESDFESYRRLGEYLTNNLLRDVNWDQGYTLEALFSFAGDPNLPPKPPPGAV